VFKQVFLAVFKHTPYMILTAPARLSSAFVESYVVCIGAHTISTAGGGWSVSIEGALGPSPMVK